MSDQSPCQETQKEFSGEKINKLNFKEAIDVLLDGKKVTREEWGDKEFYFVMDDKKLKINKPKGIRQDLIVSEEDLLCDDYLVL